LPRSRPMPMSDPSQSRGLAAPGPGWDHERMVDNFMSAGTNGGADDDEMPAPDGTGPRNQPPPTTTPPPTPAPTQQPAPEQPRPIWYQPDAEQPPVTPAPPVHPLTRRRNQLAAPK